MKKFLALYMGTQESIGQPMQMPDDATMAKGMAAWGKWQTDHADVLADGGGPLGKTKATSRNGVADIRNAVGGYTIVMAESHEAAAKLFENHPHFMIFPGDRVEVMEVLPIPGS